MSRSIKEAGMAGIRICITADDFGRSSENNAGVLAAHRAGVITATSLMVGEPGCHEAVMIARENPTLRMGLHVCLSDGVPVSAPRDIPLLVERDGQFPDDERLLKKAVLSRAGRAQVRREVIAQFARFVYTGLTCDHVNVHRNSHMHPLVANEVFRAAASHGIKNVRIPFDPRIERPRRLADPLRYGRVAVLRRLARHYQVRWVDRVIGRDWTDPTRLVALINALPPGTTELFFHPVICDGEHMFKADLPVLLDDRVRNALRNNLDKVPT